LYLCILIYYIKTNVHLCRAYRLGNYAELIVILTLHVIGISRDSRHVFFTSLFNPLHEFHMNFMMAHENRIVCFFLYMVATADYRNTILKKNWYIDKPTCFLCFYGIFFLNKRKLCNLFVIHMCIKKQLPYLSLP